MPQLVKCLMLGFGLSHDLTVHEFKPGVGLRADTVEPTWDSLSLSLSALPLTVLSLSQSKKKKKKRKEIKIKRVGHLTD